MSLEDLRALALRCSIGVRDFGWASGGYCLLDVPKAEEGWYRTTLFSMGCNLGRQGLQETIPGSATASAETAAWQCLIMISYIDFVCLF